MMERQVQALRVGAEKDAEEIEDEEEEEKEKEN